MSHCCGGCGGEDPLMKNKPSENNETKQTEDKETAKSSASAETTGTWQPDKK